MTARRASSSASLPAEFQAVYRAEVSYVLASLRRLGVSPRDLEDLAHDVFLAVYRRFGDYDRARPLRPWLFGFVYRVAADHRRLFRHRYEVGGVDVEPPDDARLPDEELATKQLQRHALEALEAVPLERRAVLIMHDLDGHPVPEVAKVLGLPLNTAYSRLRLARRDFEAAVELLCPREVPHE